MQQVAAIKREYLKHNGGWIMNRRAAPCQLCQRWIALGEASDFSHKEPAGMGGAGDKGGIVDPKNGCWSCRCCHDFVEQDKEAHAEMKASPANMADGGYVEFSPAVRLRHRAWIGRWNG